MNRIVRLDNPVQPYAWGSPTAIPELLGKPNPDGEPQAELWMGTHPKGASRALCEGQAVPLSECIEQDPVGVLGKHVAEQYDGRLPFLFKVLAAAKPLSIQAHPDKAQAEQGFARENADGLALDAFERNYRDDNHKPETICALVPFWAVRGFRAIPDLLGLAEALGLTALEKELAALHGAPDRTGLKTFFATVMQMDKARQAAAVQQAVAAAEKLWDKDPAFDWVVKLNAEYPGDIGVLAPVLLNLICLQPGQAMFLPAGELHAYLDGVGIELMANSDNVLRGGLTPKHMDVPELLRTLTFSTGPIELLMPEESGPAERRYPALAEEFQLSVLQPTQHTSYAAREPHDVEILICTEGHAQIKAQTSDAALEIAKGSSLLVPAAAGAYRIEGNATLYRASVPG